MGVESKFYILPDSSNYRPDSAKVSALIQALRSAGYLFDPKAPLPGEHSFQEGFQWKWKNHKNKGDGLLADLEKFISQHEESDILVQWPTKDLAASGLKYPLSVLPHPEEVYYDIEFQLADQTAYHTSELIDPFEMVRCSCGSELHESDSPEDDLFYDLRLPNFCPACHRPTNYATLPMTFRDGWTGARSRGIGGVTCRFCIVIDCGKMIPPQGTVVVPDFLAIVEKTLPVKTRTIQDFY